MKKLLSRLLVLVALFVCTGQAMAQARRPIDSQHPLWLVHIDVWNKADPQKIINLIPDDIKPYVCMNLSLSCQYDTKLNVYKMPQNAILTYKSWASVCQANNLWFTCQPASGGHTHIMDDDLATFEYFFKHYPNFLGWNYAEQFWGFDEAGDHSSSTQASRWALFANLVEMSHKYGGFLTVSFCGNIWSHALNPNGIMSLNKKLRENCQKYPEAFLLLYKYTTSSCFYNNESVCLAPFISGLAANYGVRYDNCGWNGALDALLGDNHGKKYPASVGIGTVMEQTCVNGGAVWDGPELIWTEDFQNLSNSTVDGYTRRNWGTFKTFDNIWIDMFRKVIDGTMYVPTRQEVVGRNKVVIINDQSGNDQVKYAAPDDLYDGLYRLSDPMNRGNGRWMDNFCFFKSTGRYQPIPVVLGLYDELAKSIPVQVKRTAYSTRWNTQTKKVNEFKRLYPIVSEGDLFVSRLDNQLITYYNHSSFYKAKTLSAEVPLQYNTCSSLGLEYGRYTSGVIREYEDSITFYLNNYRTDTVTQVTNVITVKGATQEPTFTYKKHSGTTLTKPTSTWDAETGTFTLTVKMMGPVDIVLHCAGAETERDTNPRKPVALDLPKQPEDVLCDLIIEAEDMDYKNIKSCVTDPYGWYPNVRGHAGNGFADMGTNTQGALRGYVRAKHAGTYTVAVRYTCTTTGGAVNVKVGNKSVKLKLDKTAFNEWRKATITATLNGGNNTFFITNTGGKAMYIDNVTFIPEDKVKEKYEIRLQKNAHGTLVCETDSAYENDIVTIEAIPDEGYAFEGWEVVHGDITITDNQFTMPDDDVEIRAVFKDISLAYMLDFTGVLTGTMPYGWRAVQENGDVHEYPNSFSSGARTFLGFAGYQKAALYWRNDCAEYGRLSAYPLTLASGHYELKYAMAAWKGSPKYNVQIETLDGKVVASDKTYTAAPNVNGSTTASINSATERTLQFHIADAGNYVVRFLDQSSTSGGLTEFLLAECKISTIPNPDAIADAKADATQGKNVVYDLLGRKTDTRHNGNIYIIRTPDGKVTKRLVK